MAIIDDGTPRKVTIYSITHGKYAPTRNQNPVKIHYKLVIIQTQSLLAKGEGHSEAYKKWSYVNAIKWPLVSRSYLRLGIPHLSHHEPGLSNQCQYTLSLVDPNAEFALNNHN